MMISFLFGVTFLVAQQRSSILGYPWTSSRTSTIIQDAVDVQLVSDAADETPHHRGRQPRQVAQPADVATTTTTTTTMPANLHFRFQMGARQVDLQMGKDSKGVADIPLFVIEGGRIKKKELRRDDNFQLYSNQSTGSTFMVKKSDNRAKFILEGFFYDGLDQLHLTPDPSGALHRIHKQAREVDLRDDYINSITTEGVTTESTRAPNIYKRSTRSRRQGEGQRDHEIRLFMVADYQEYQNWWNYYQNNSTRTEIEMNNFYSFIANSINIRYRSISEMDPSFHVEIVVTGLLTVNSPMVSSWTEGNTLKPGSRYVNAYRALEDFGLWVRRRHVDLPMSDHWMLFTGYDIYTDRNPVVAGLARLSTMCSLSSVSIIEQDYTGSVGATAAHELGHSLGSLHDGEETDCLDEDNYVMSRKLKTPDNDSRASRPWQFSKCSVRAFKRFLSKVQCTNKSSRSQSLMATNLSPGQIFSADKQCNLALGNGSYFARRLQYREGYSTMCRRMYCSVPNVTGLYQAIFPMERTSCGDRKWCQRGRCERHMDAPSMADNCPQGDDPTAPCVLEDCPLYTPWTKIGFCCHLCRATQREGGPNMINNFLHMSVVKKVLSPSSTEQAGVAAQTTAASLTAHEPTAPTSQDLIPTTTGIYASLFNGGLDHRSTESTDTIAVHISNPANDNSSNADVTEVSAGHPAPSDSSNDTVKMMAASDHTVTPEGTRLHASMTDSASVSGEATTGASPLIASAVSMTTDVRIQHPQITSNWSSSGHEELSAILIDNSISKIYNRSISLFYVKSGNSSTINSSTINSSTINSSTINSSTINSSTINSNTINSSTINSSTIDNSNIDSSNIDSSNINTSTINSSTSNSSTISTSTISSSNINSSSINSSSNSTSEVYVTDTPDASVDRPLQANTTLTTLDSDNRMSAENVGDPSALPKMSLAWHLGLTPKNRTSDPNQWDPDSSLNMIHRGVVSGLGPGPVGVEDSRADMFRLNLVAGVKDRLSEVAAHSSSNRSLAAAHDVTSAALKGTLDNLSYDAGSVTLAGGTSSHSETNHISVAPFAPHVQVPMLMATILWSAATTPLPNSTVTQRTAHGFDLTKLSFPFAPDSSHTSSSSSSSAASPVKSASSLSSLSSKERTFYDKLKEDMTPSAAVHLDGAAVGGPSHSSFYPAGAGPWRSGQDNVDVFSSGSVKHMPQPASNATVRDGHKPSPSDPHLPLWEVPYVNLLPEPSTGNESPQGKSLVDYQARWWRDALAPHNHHLHHHHHHHHHHHALEVMDYAVNFPNGDSPPPQIGDRNTNRSPLSVNQPPRDLADGLGPRGHKVEIISFQPHLRRFFEELTSVDSLTTRSQRGPLTTPEPDRQRFFPNCRFQCVFYRELTGPPRDMTGQFIDYLIRARSASNQLAPSSQAASPGSAVDRVTSFNRLQRLVV